METMSSSIYPPHRESNPVDEHDQVLQAEKTPMVCGLWQKLEGDNRSATMASPREWFNVEHSGRKPSAIGRSVLVLVIPSEL